MRGKKKFVFKFKKRVKIIRIGETDIILTKDKPVNYWYCRVYNPTGPLTIVRPPYRGDITNKFKDIAPYFEHTNRLIIYHDMALKLICKRVQEINDKYEVDWCLRYRKRNKPAKKKRRIKNESIRDPRFNYLRCYLRLRSYRSRH